MLRFDLDQKCLATCHKASYTYSPRTRIQSEDPVSHMSSMFRMFFVTPSDQVKFTREHQLYDFNTILAAVGGSMGMFLGFSCLQFSLVLVEKGKSLKCMKEKSKERGAKAINST